jgi:hypothetical protein
MVEPKVVEPKVVDKVPYRVVTAEDLFHLSTKYHHLSNYEHAVKLLVDEGLLILKKDEVRTNENTKALSM